MPENSSLKDQLSSFISGNKLRAGSLIITLFGDVISLHGNQVSLASIIEELSVFELNHRQIRTAVFRLVQEQWLEGFQQGRRSFYSFTQSGQRQFERAARRIYAKELAPWDERWTIVLLGQLENPIKDRLRRELAWLGFGQISAGAFAHPNPSKQNLADLIVDLDVQDRVLVLHGQVDSMTSPVAVESITYHSWRLSEIRPRYEQYCSFFSGILKQLENRRHADTQQMFILRLILIHEYRRLLLKTPELPGSLLPDSWLASAALDITATLYHTVFAGSSQYICNSFQTAEGKLPPTGHELARF